MGRTCDRCGKVLKGTTDEALKAHQRESESCRPRIGAGESSKIKELDNRLQFIIAEGRRISSEGGSFEEIEKNAKQRKAAEDALKEARDETKAEKKMLRALAEESLSASSWTESLKSAVCGEGDARFERGDDAIDQKLAQETVGLVSAAAFREKRLAVEAQILAKHSYDKEAQLQREVDEKRKRREKKRKREQEQRRGLSFDDNLDNE